MLYVRTITWFKSRKMWKKHRQRTQSVRSRSLANCALSYCSTFLLIVLKVYRLHLVFKCYSSIYKNTLELYPIISNYESYSTLKMSLSLQAHNSKRKMRHKPNLLRAIIVTLLCLLKVLSIKIDNNCT
jgi:hypothetical protein